MRSGGTTPAKTPSESPRWRYTRKHKILKLPSSRAGSPAAEQQTISQAGLRNHQPCWIAMFGLRRKFGRFPKQWVCTVCGYNMIGVHPDRCPFCSARRDRMLASAAVSRRYRVTVKPVNATVSQLTSSPRLGLEHAAYRIDGEGGSAWIDCPSAFNRDLRAVDVILFTHKDFIGAANQYKKLWGSEVWLHEADAELSEVSRHSVNHPFSADFEKFGIQGIHIGGHSPGFTVYIWQDMLFVCDYVYPPGAGMKLNPHGNRDATREGAGKLADVISGRALSTVCGYNYVAPFADWQTAFLRLI
jgi:hydroxyacylglutathione hydrolase